MQWLIPFRNAFCWLGGLRPELIRAKSLQHLLLIAVFLAVAGGLLMFFIDPNIRSPLDGIWYAWVTMTHVGYGDVVPVSFFGRCVAALLILFGLALFALFTASMSLSLIGREIGEIGRGVTDAREEAGQGRTDQARLMRDLLDEMARLRQRLDELEHPADRDQIQG